LNAFVTVDAEKSLNSARAADARIAAGTAGLLTGIPIAQKDIFCAEGWRTTCGSKMLANFVSPYDATVIRKMESEAGLVSLGKTNMDEFAMGSSNETSFFGPVRNPWDRPGYPAVRPAVRRPPWRPVWRRRRPVPIPAARSASRQRCAT
jgi:aspartyl-tRNA(Asn)/glutamyl-tRNA(Gln) amidotransferase subunit A